MSKILSGKTIVITRPRHQAMPLAQQIQDWGGQSILFPTLEIESTIPQAPSPSQGGGQSRQRALYPHPNPPPQRGRELEGYDFGIFVSANAVRCAQSLFTPVWTITNIAIGPGTAKALQQLQMQVDWMPSVHHSEGVLDLPVLQHIEGKKILIFCGENSRTLLKDNLIKRGAKVDELICYRRKCPQVDGINTLAQWRQTRIDLIISTSLESLENLWRILEGINNEWLRSVPLLVISPSMQNHAQNLGFQVIYLAAGASDLAIEQTLKQIFAGIQI